MMMVGWYFGQRGFRVQQRTLLLIPLSLDGASGEHLKLCCTALHGAVYSGLQVR